MVFSSTVFLLIFLPLTIILYYLPIKNSNTYKNIILLIASLFFYAWGEPFFIFILLLSITVNYYLGLKVKTSARPKLILIFGIIWNISILVFFKYTGFIIENLKAIGFIKPAFNFSIKLPIGISFFTFQILSYLIDVYKNQVPSQKNYYKLCLYVSFFPQLIAGPIVRYSDIEKEIESRQHSVDLFITGFQRFIIGLSKKCLIANYVAIIADRIFNLGNYEIITLTEAWIAAISYTFQIYFDFSGYSDMAIGLGKMFGFNFKENFNNPYCATSITDFWRRWHISLSSWFRDYIYIPLGGNRCSFPRKYINLLVVWLLTGLWHGAAWTFIIWGLYYYFLLLFEKVTLKDVLKNRYFSFLYQILTLFFIVIGWIIFRCNNMNSLLLFLKSLFNLKNFGFSNLIGINLTYIFLVCIFFSLIKPRFSIKKINNSIFYHTFLNISYTILFVLSILSCINNSYNPFIYFNF